MDDAHARMCSAQQELFSHIAEADRSELWADDGARDMAHWLWMRYGLSDWRSRRWIGAAHALEGLPRLSEAFSTGELGVDKVVELTRFATPETEGGADHLGPRVSSGRIRYHGDLAARGQLTEVQARLQAADSRLLTLAGPALADGRYVGKLFAVANTAPQRLAIRVFATIKGDSTAQPGWRVLEVAPDTKVRLTTLRGVGPRTMTFAWFAHVFNSGVPQNASVHGTEYWVTLESGLLTAMGEHRVT